MMFFVRKIDEINRNRGYYMLRYLGKHKNRELYGRTIDYER